MLELNHYPPGEHSLMLSIADQKLESQLYIPAKPTKNVLAIICHPHSLFGGTMQNKVVTTNAKACVSVGYKALCFNFRGVSKSTGEYNAGIAESEDLANIIQQVKELNSEIDIILIGFSFGSYVAARALAIHQVPVSKLVLIAPPVENFDFASLGEFSIPWIVIQGEADEIVPPELVYAWFAGRNKPGQLIKMPAVSHFFHGQLIQLKQLIQQLIL